MPSIGRAVRVEGAPAPEADLTRALYEQYGNQIFRYCMHQLGSREEAEDAVQSTFLNAFRGIKRGVVPELESAWLFKIAHNVCLSRRRTSWRRGRIESPTDFDVVEELTPAPSRRSDELIGLQDVLEQMPESQRRAILLREWQGLSYREIAAELELTQAAVETLIFRARRSLAAGLEQPSEAKKRKLARGTDLGNLLAGVKSLLLGGATAAKVAATVAVVSASTVVAAAPVVHHARSHHPSPPAAQTPAATAPARTTRSVAGSAASFPTRAADRGAKVHRPSRLELFAGLDAASGGFSRVDESALAVEPAPAAAEPVPAAATPAATPAAEPQSQPTQSQRVEPQHAVAATVQPAPAEKVLTSEKTKGSEGTGAAATPAVQQGSGNSDSKGNDSRKTSVPVVTLPTMTLSVQPPATTAPDVKILLPVVAAPNGGGNNDSQGSGDSKKRIAPVQAPALTVTLPAPAPAPATVPAVVTASVQPVAPTSAWSRGKDMQDKGSGNG